MEWRRVTQALMAMILGGLLGYLAMRLYEMGIVFALAMAGVLAAFYVTRGRAADVGWLLLGIGAAPGWILGSNALRAVTDPSWEVDLTTWVGLLVAIGVSGFGVVLVLTLSNGQAGRTDA